MTPIGYVHKDGDEFMPAEIFAAWSKLAARPGQADEWRPVWSAVKAAPTEGPGPAGGILGQYNAAEIIAAMERVARAQPTTAELAAGLERMARACRDRQTFEGTAHMTAPRWKAIPQGDRLKRWTVIEADGVGTGRRVIAENIRREDEAQTIAAAGGAGAPRHHRTLDDMAAEFPPREHTAAVFLRALADLLEEHQATLGYSTDDRGVEIDVAGVEVAAIWCNDTASGAKELRERADQLEARGC